MGSAVLELGRAGPNLEDCSKNNYFAKHRFMQNNPVFFKSKKVDVFSFWVPLFKEMKSTNISPNQMKFAIFGIFYRKQRESTSRKDDQ